MKRKLKILLLVLVCLAVGNVYSQSRQEIKIAMLLPLYYDNIDELSFNQYNIAEKRNANYRCFSYISFYEGARIALDKLERQGYKITFFVFDVGESDIKKTSEVLEQEEMKEMDLIVPLVFKNSFDLISKFSQEHQIPLVNPMSPNNDILLNEYVFKIQPDDISIAQTTMKYIQEKHSNSNVIILYEDSKKDNSLINWYKSNINSYTSSWTIINYKKNAAKLKNYFKPNVKNIVINLITKIDPNENKVFANTLTKKLFGFNNYDITLFAPFEWLDFSNIDYSMLERLDYHFTLTYLNDYTNPNFVDFVKEYRKHFRTEPDKIYAALGYDIMMYFIKALKEKKQSLTSEPNIKDMQEMINHYHFRHLPNYPGWQNETTTIYNIKNYKIKSEWSY